MFEVMLILRYYLNNIKTLNKNFVVYARMCMYVCKRKTNRIKIKETTECDMVNKKIITCIYIYYIHAIMGTRRRTRRTRRIITRTKRQRYMQKNKRSRFSLKGGTLIGQGNYGCVFRPDILTKNSSIVSKIVLRNNIFNEFRHEYKILKKMKTIDSDGKFHSLLSNAFELTKNNLPDDFDKCSLSKPDYKVDEFFVFNILYSGDTNLESYIARIDDIDYNKLAILFTLITNIIVGIYKMIKSNLVHKTLKADSIYFIESVSMSNPYALKIIDFGEGEVRKYKNHKDSNYDYVTFFKSMINMLTTLQSKVHTNTLLLLLQGFKTLLQNVEKISSVASVSSYRTIITQYIDMLGNVFGEKYKKYALEKYKVT